MKHLTRAELVEYIEAPVQLTDRRADHVRECPACRAQADALRDVLARAAGDPMPEPSPLFWDHFAARVSDAIRSESFAETRSWRARPLTTWAVATAVAVLVIVTITWRTTLQAPYFPRVPMAPTASAPRTGGGSPALQPSDVDNVEADAAWAVVRVAAEDLEWEDVHAAGISAPSGAAEGLALELTADERSELARLLQKELNRNGV